jgi:tRNA U34 5-carboxymethylaminomethyl modifying GTPase MnmE/TrmE
MLWNGWEWPAVWSFLEQADLVLHVLDRSEPLSEEDFEVLEGVPGMPRRIVLINKVDLPPLWDLDDLGDVGDSPVLEMSLLVDGTQVVNRLADAILGLVGSGSIASSAGSRALITRTRHKQALQEAQGAA